MTRAEYLEWCKGRAREYLDVGALGDAVASMLSDLGKNPETEKSVQPELGMIGIMAAANGDASGVRAFIEGFR
jgi:hypothetical protein